MGTLSIGGTGSLDVAITYGGPAAIGSNGNANTKNIVFNGGNIHAYAQQGAAIGGGNYGSESSNITINGGSLIAESVDGAGIGAGMYTKVQNISINGGTVIARCIRGKSAGIGNGYAKTNDSRPIITGGSVVASSSQGQAFASSMQSNTIMPVDGQGRTLSLYELTIVQIPIKNQAVSFDGALADYGDKDVYTDENGSVYLYLPQDELPTEPVIITSGEYNFDGVVLNSDPRTTMCEGEAVRTISGGQVLDISKGNITIDDNYVYAEGRLYYASVDDNYSISGDTQKYGITVVKDVSANLILEDAQIDVGAVNRCAPILIEDDSSGNVTVTLKGDNVLRAGSGAAGIQKNGSGDSVGTLTIAGDGTLAVNGQSGCAGIGASENRTTRRIVINGGTINTIGGKVDVYGEYFGAGIGGGWNSSNNPDGTRCQDIMVNGGTITANCFDIIAGQRNFAAGIGSGYFGNVDNITINGGSVTAKGSSGAGIGGGYNRVKTSSSVSNITINGGTIHASSDDGAGIGSGRYEVSDVGTSINNECTGIRITGGDVHTSSGAGAAIGSGENAKIGDITISGGTVQASSWEGAAIGKGVMVSGLTDVVGGVITISGGTVNASSMKGAAIGGTQYGAIEKVIITGGTVNATRNGGRTDAIGTSVSSAYQPMSPVDAAGTALYLTQLHMMNGETPAAGQTVTSLTAVVDATGVSYGLQDVKSDENGIVYAYLPENANTTKLVANGVYENGTGVTTTADNLSSKIFTMGGNLLIHNQPQDQTYVLGGEADSVTFGLTSSDGATYQWQKYVDGAWSDITEAQSKDYTMTDITYDQNGSRYRCVVSYGGDTIYSDAATLTVQKQQAALTMEPAVNKTYGDDPFVLTVAGIRTGGTIVAQSVYPDIASIENINQTTGEITVKILKVGTVKINVTVAGDDTYEDGAASCTLTINKAVYDMSSVRWNYTSAYTVDGTDKTVQINGTLPNGVTVDSYTGNTATKVGQYTAHVNFSYDEENYEMPQLADCQWQIQTIDLSKATVSAIVNKEYTGSTITQNPTVQLAGVTLVNGRDYSITYQNNRQVGTATMVITGTGNYAGTITRTFQITAKAPTIQSISKASVTGIKNMIHTGKTITLKPVVKVGSVTLVNGRDYTITYKNNKNPGTATLTIRGKGNYNGAVTRTFRINAKKGSSYTVGNYRYKVTNASTSGKGTVQLIRVAKKSSTVSIGNTVKIGGVNYKITDIVSKAFYKNTKMTKLVIGSNVTKIGAESFNSCTKLRTITIGSNVKYIGKKAFYNCKAATAVTIKTGKLTTKTVSSSAFTKLGANNYKKLVVKVPKKQLKTYRTVLKKRGLSTKAKVK